MHLLASYFLPLIDSKNKLNHELIYTMITWHDMAEAIVSDMTTKSKTDQHKANEKEAEASLVENATDHLREIMQTIYNTYDDRTTEEAKFVKALDKIEPMFHLFFLKTKNLDMKVHFTFEWEADEYREHRAKFVDQFIIIKQFDDIFYHETFEYYSQI
jgi:5'-deoxynucleotidase YfbR-like HD superfamily hydrolase